MNKNHNIINDLKDSFQQGYEKGYILNLYRLAEKCVITEEQTAEKVSQLEEK